MSRDYTTDDFWYHNHQPTESRLLLERKERRNVFNCVLNPPAVSHNFLGPKCLWRKESVRRTSNTTYSLMFKTWTEIKKREYISNCTSVVKKKKIENVFLTLFHDIFFCLSFVLNVTILFSIIMDNCHSTFLTVL